MQNNILDSLLVIDKPKIIQESGTAALRYKDLKTARVNGKRAVVLPDGRMISKAMDRRLGRPVWIVVGRRLT
jgi:hypothetical protein